MIQEATQQQMGQLAGKWLVVMQDARYDESGPTRLAYICDDEQAALEVVERHNQKTPPDSPDAPYWRAYAVQCLPPGEEQSTPQDAKQLAGEADQRADGLLAKWDAQQGPPIVPGLFIKHCPDVCDQDEGGNDIPESRGHFHRLDFCPDRSGYLDRDEAFDLFVMIDDRNGPTLERVAGDRLRAAAAELAAMAEQIDPTPADRLPHLHLELTGGGKPRRVIEFPDPRAAFAAKFQADGDNPGRTLRPVSAMVGESADLSFAAPSSDAPAKGDLTWAVVVSKEGEPSRVAIAHASQHEAKAYASGINGNSDLTGRHAEVIPQQDAKQHASGGGERLLVEIVGGRAPRCVVEFGDPRQEFCDHHNATACDGSEARPILKPTPEDVPTLSFKQKVAEGKVTA